jgi:hypothetical protein
MVKKAPRQINAPLTFGPRTYRKVTQGRSSPPPLYRQKRPTRPQFHIGKPIGNGPPPTPIGRRPLGPGSHPTAASISRPEFGSPHAKSPPARGPPASLQGPYNGPLTRTFSQHPPPSLQCCVHETFFASSDCVEFHSPSVEVSRVTFARAALNLRCVSYCKLFLEAMYHSPGLPESPGPPL